MSNDNRLTGSHLINGQWVAAGTKTFQGENPATGEKLSPQFGEAGKAEVNAALSAAGGAFEAAFDLPHGWQAKLLDAIAARIMDLGDALLERGEQETALPRARLAGERGRTCGQLKMFADLVREGSWVDAVIDTADPNRTPAPKPDLRRMLRARGPVVVFGASNFPFAFSVCGGDTASALAAGCPVVVKAHPSHPGTSEMFAAAVLAALKELSLPLGLFSMLQGRSNELGAALVKHPATTAVGFTGSNRGGRALFDLAAARPTPIPVYAEMGSLNPLVILPEAIAERGEAIAKGLAGSVLLGGGQFCTKPGVVFVVGEAGRSFIDTLSKQIAATASVTMLNKPLRDSFVSRTGEFAHVNDVKSVLTSQAGGYAEASPALLETTCNVWLREQKLREEAFGPATLVIRCTDIQEAVNGVKTIGGALTGTLHVGANDTRESITAITRALESIAGRVIVNGYPTGVEVNHAIVHGGPYPATTDPGTTSVGSAAIRRFTRLIAYQDAPQSILPPELKDDNPLKIARCINGGPTRDAIAVATGSSH